MKRASDHRRLPRAEPPPIIRLTGDQILKPQIERLVQNLLRVADEALASTHIVEKDRALLEQAKVNLKGVQPLVEMLSSTGDAADGATGLALLLHALSGAYRVGARATITASAVVYSKRLWRGARAQSSCRVTPSAGVNGGHRGRSAEAQEQKRAVEGCGCDQRPCQWLAEGGGAQAGEYRRNLQAAGS